MKVILACGDFLNTAKGNIINIESFSFLQFHFFQIITIMVSRNSSVTCELCCLYLDCFQLNKNWSAAFICSFLFLCNLCIVFSVVIQACLLLMIFFNLYLSILISCANEFAEQIPLNEITESKGVEFEIVLSKKGVSVYNPTYSVCLCSPDLTSSVQY